MYLLDTDILCNLMKRTPSTALIARLAGVPAEQQFTSSVVLGELTSMARRLPVPALLERLERALLPNLPVLPFDAEAAKRYGEVRAEMEDQGIIVGDAELRIGAIALAHDLTVVTGSVQRFRGIPGLAVESWLEEPVPAASLLEEPASIACESEEPAVVGREAVESVGGPRETGDPAVVACETEKPRSVPRMSIEVSLRRGTRRGEPGDAPRTVNAPVTNWVWPPEPSDGEGSRSNGGFARDADLNFADGYA